MSRPLPPGDPAQLGPYRLSARLSETSAGIVFLGEDHEGRRASVAVLTRGAAGDAAARDRFRAAITAALPGPGRPPEFGPEGPAPVVAARPDGPAPWVATRYDADRPDRAGAERFLDSVLLEGSFRGGWGGRRRGPQFQPYWLGSGAPALERPPEQAPPRPVAAERAERGLVSAILTLAAVLVVLALLMMVLFACQPKVKDQPPPPPEPTLQTPTPSPPPTTEVPSPSPSRPTPSPGDSGGDDGGGPV
ncbi:hypothetical protein ACGFNU_19945 [Spirillospora sp. NPDC048911]|uniref:hypothetical protein n=1 Tax=Spirillospora sp. NPDC048911 TaxID=3364527 RepID=UPI00371A4C67